ncbi:hypothetical protein OTU49_005894, partial [Cherax quadricarinatus]
SPLAASTHTSLTWLLPQLLPLPSYPAAQEVSSAAPEVSSAAPEVPSEAPLSPYEVPEVVSAAPGGTLKALVSSEEPEVASNALEASSEEPEISEAPEAHTCRRHQRHPAYSRTHSEAPEASF